MQVIPNDTVTTRPGRARHRILPCLGIVAAAPLLWLLYTRLAFNLDPNSDNASIVLQAESFLRGNLLLRGWCMSAVTYALDLPFYALGIMVLGGIDPLLIRVVPAFIAMVMVLLAVGLAARGGGREHPVLSGLVAFLLAGVPSHLLGLHYFYGPNHTTMLAVVLAGLMLVDAPGRDRAGWGRPALFGLLLALAQFTDAMAMWIVALPVLMVCSARAVLKRGEESYRELQLIAVTISSVFLARGALALVAAAGGCTVPGIPHAFTLTDRLGRNLELAVNGILGMSGADFFGRTLNGGTLLTLLHLPGLALVLSTVRRVLRSWRARAWDDDLVRRSLPSRWWRTSPPTS